MIFKPANIFVLALLLCLVTACRENPPHRQNDLKLEFRDLMQISEFGEPQRSFKEEFAAQRKDYLQQYLAFPNSADFRFEKFTPAPGDFDVIYCLKHGSDKRPSRVYDETTIQTASFYDKMKFGMISGTDVTEYGRTYQVTSIFSIMPCQHLLSDVGFNSVFISPEIVPDEQADDRLLFMNFDTRRTLEAYVDPFKNLLVVKREPRLTEAKFRESLTEKGCLFSVLEQGKAAAQNASLTNLCPNSSAQLTPISISYPLTYYWFGDAEIEALKKKEETEEYTDEILVTNKNLKDTKVNYIVDMRYGGSERPAVDHIDLGTDNFVWSPFTRHKEAWEKAE